MVPALRQRMQQFPDQRGQMGRKASRFLRTPISTIYIFLSICISIYPSSTCTPVRVE